MMGQAENRSLLVLGLGVFVAGIALTLLIVAGGLQWAWLGGVVVVAAGILALWAFSGSLFIALTRALAVTLAAASYLGLWLLFAFADVFAVPSSDSGLRLFFVIFLALHGAAAVLIAIWQALQIRPLARLFAWIILALFALFGIAAVTRAAGAGGSSNSLAMLAAAVFTVAVLVYAVIYLLQSLSDPLALPFFMRTGAGLGAMIPAETISFFTVVVGVGGFQLFSNLSRGFWYLGVLVSWLGLLAGLALHYRWLQGPARLDNRAAPTGSQMWVGVGVMLCTELTGLAALLSLLAPANPVYMEQRAGALVSALALAVILAGSLFMVFGAKTLRFDAEGQGATLRRMLLTAALWGVLLVGIAAAILFSAVGFQGRPNSLAYSRAGEALGALAALLAAISEILKSWPYARALLDGSFGRAAISVQDYLAWERSLWVLVATLVLMVFLGIGLFVEIPRFALSTGLLTLDPLTGALTGLFLLAVVLAGAAALRAQLARTAA